MSKDESSTRPFPGDSPCCKCHGEQMYWQKDSRAKVGGYWRCRIYSRLARARYRKSEKGRAAWRGKKSRWYHNPANADAVLRQLMRKQIRDHARRLEVLEKRLEQTTL